MSVSGWLLKLPRLILHYLASYHLITKFEDVCMGISA